MPLTPSFVCGILMNIIMRKILLTIFALFVIGSANAKEAVNISRPNVDVDAVNIDSVQLVSLADSLEQLKTRVDTIESKVQYIRCKVENGEYNRTQLWVRIMLYSLAFLIVLTIVYVIFCFVRLRDNVVDIVKDSARIKDWLDDRMTKSISKNISAAMPKYQETGNIRNLQNECDDLKNKVERLEDIVKEMTTKNSPAKEENKVKQKQDVQSNHVQVQKCLYADSIINGYFSHVRETPDDDTFFILQLKNETTSKIVIFPQAQGKILANPSSYLEGCEKQIIGNSSVFVTKEGESVCDENGKWKVVSPLKVEIR